MEIRSFPAGADCPHREFFLTARECGTISEAMDRMENQIEILRQALEAFTSRSDADEIVSELERFLARFVPHGRNAICFFEGEGLRLHDSKGESRNGAIPDNALLRSMFRKKIREADRPILLPMPGSDPGDGDSCVPIESGVYLAVPMRAGVRNTGCVILERSDREPFDEPRALLAQLLANEAAIALEHARLRQKVEMLTTIDPLTGLHTRRQFDAASRIEFRRSQRFRLKLSVVMMDIDHLMRVNDGYGRVLGDKVLAGAADVCLRGIRLTDLHARYGPEEFCFLLPETDQRGAHVLAERLRGAVSGLRFESDKRSFSVTASFGIAERQPDTDSIEALLAQGDQALFRAKSEGRNRIVTWTPACKRVW